MWGFKFDPGQILRDRFNHKDVWVVQSLSSKDDTYTLSRASKNTSKGRKKRKISRRHVESLFEIKIEVTEPDTSFLDALKDI